MDSPVLILALVFVLLLLLHTPVAVAIAVATFAAAWISMGSMDVVAAVIAQARSHEVALKFTAGLHHPVRFRAREPEVMMHGFLNVFGAACLAWGADLKGDELVACVAETDPAAFVFEGETFAWRGHAVTAATIRHLRSRWLCGFGSCSFAEPRDDLFKLGLF